VAFVIGSVGLLLATATDAIAVLGRHAGFTVLGSIEIVQAAVVLIAASSMLLATLVNGHAAVHILTERLSRARAMKLAHVAALLSAGMMILLAVGSLWVLSESWSGYERSELLHIPLRWLRTLLVLALAIIAALFIAAALKREAQ
jgi:TRAP-type C4-dicarboxylate transport system permease small subunit